MCNVVFISLRLIMSGSQRKIDNYKHTARKHLCDLIEFSDVDELTAGGGEGSTATAKQTSVFGNIAKPEREAPTSGADKPGEGTDVDPELSQLMAERETTMDKIKELVGMTKNSGKEGDVWSGLLEDLDDFENDPHVKRGSFGDGGSAYECTACDKKFSGNQPLRAHLKSQNHRKKIGQINSEDVTNPQPFMTFMREFELGENRQDSRLTSCGAHACTHHCRVCDKCMTGVTPAKQHLDSDKHKKKERDLEKIHQARTMSSLGSSSNRLPESFESSRRSSSLDCPKLGCISHCVPCNKCFFETGALVQHAKTTGHTSILLTSPLMTASECGDVSISSVLSEYSNGRSMESFSSHVSSLAWDGYQPPLQPDFIEKNTCTTLGCSYHCICCDKHLSGEEPMRQHIKSVKHLTMEEVYKRGMGGKKSPTSLESSPSLYDSDASMLGLDNGMNSLRLASGNDTEDVEEVTGACGKIGCAFHCNLCSTCLSGTVPKNQHLKSKNHCQIRERLERVAQPFLQSDSVAREACIRPASPDSGVEFSECSQPGCAYHCHVCDMHFTGREPMQQHMVSKSHEKRKKATVSLQRQSTPSFGGSEHGVAEDVSEASCAHPGCRFHCNICDAHLSGMDPMKQHMESLKHDKKKQAYLKLGGGARNSNMVHVTTDLSSSSTSQAVQTPDNNPFASLQPQDRQQPKPIGYERSVRSTSSADMNPKAFSPYGGSLRSTNAIHVPQGNGNRITGHYPTEAGQHKSVFGACPESSRICKLHCFACDKHFNESLPKQQHETSSKHQKAAQRYMVGLKTQVVDQEDSFIVPSSGNTELQLKTQLKTSKSSNSLVGLPKWLGEDRQLPPIVKLPTSSKYTPQTKTVARDYQMELYRKAMKDDTVCFLPTGTGKTLVSALVIDHMLEMNPTRPVLFLVEKILLVLQQTKYLRTELGEKQYQRLNPRTNSTEMRALNVAGLCSGHTDACGKSSLQELDVIVATAGFFLNLMSKEWLKWQDFCLIVIDEVHHTTKKHAFNTLMQDFHLQLHKDGRPKLFGMTASPAGEANVPLTQQMLQILLENIGMAKLCIVEDHAKQLGEFQTRTELEIDLAKMSDDETLLEDDIQMYLLHIFNFLIKTTNLGSLCKEFGLNIQDGQRPILNAAQLEGEGLEAFRSSLGMIEVKDKCRSMGRFIKRAIGHADAVCGALLGLRLCGEEAVYHSLMPLADDESNCGFEQMAKVGFSCQGLQERANSYNLNIEDRRSKMTAFWRLVDRITTGIEWNDPDLQDKKPIVMVIVRERKVAKLLATLLQGNCYVQQKGLNVEYIVGHGNGEVGMSVSRQKKMLEETWQHRYQVLVATSVAEEGLDLPECRLVIEMDPPGNVTSLVQIRGRARKQCSRLVALCRTEAQVDKIRDLEDKEECMIAAANAVVGQQNLAAKRAMLSVSS